MIRPRKTCLAALLGAACALHVPSAARAEFLFNSFIVPPSSLNADRTSWDVFYSPYNGQNYPDIRAPYGTKQTASAAGFTPPANSSPSDPTAFFDTRNATITETANVNAFIIDPGNSGNIYSFSGPTAYRVDNSTANYSSPYDLGTVAFQFQTAGTLIDFSSIQLQYTDASNVFHTLTPNELLREYRGTTGSSFGGLTNRAAAQWDLSGLGIRTYQIVFSAAGSSNSLQLATLATSALAGEIVPTSRVWSAGGTGNWSNGFSSPQGAGGLSANANGNVRFANTAVANTTLDGNYTVGEVRFTTAAATTVNSPGGFTLTANTGITTTTAATGTYTFNANYALGAFNIFDLAAGTTVLNGTVSGGYGFEKDGGGALTLNGNNTFTGSVTVGGGTLRISGANAYGGAVTVQQGTLVLGGNAPNGAAGTLGNATSSVTVGADSSLFTFPGQTPSAALVVDGNYTVGRDVTFAPGTYEKRLAATNTTAATGATFTGAVDLGTATDVKFTATAATDRLNFTGAITGGAAGGTVTVDGAGTVVFSGAAKNYASATVVKAGMLQLASGTSFTGVGAVSVSNGAALRVDGTLGGTGTLTIGAGVLTGSGTVSRAFTLGTGATLSPGTGVGTLSTVGETWAGGGVYRWEISSSNSVNSGNNPGQDLVSISGSLSLGASAANRFVLQLRTLTVAGAAGSLGDFNPAQSYAWRLATTTGGITGFDATEFQVDSSGFANANGTFSVSQVGNDLYLNYAAVPEPSTWMLLGLGLLGMLIPRFKNLRSKPKQNVGDSCPTLHRLTVRSRLA